MDNYFKNKIIWITGASSGIGEALAYALSESGARLILSGRRSQELDKVKQTCYNPENTSVLPFDLLNSDLLEEITISAISLFGHIDIMVHNGGVSQRSTVIDTSMEVQRRVMELDYFSYIAITKYLLPHFASRKSGHFVVTSSIMGKIGTPMRSAYAAAKHALHGYFDCLRAEVAGDNIKVTILTPGYINTNISLNALTKDGSRMGTLSENIANGLPSDKAAIQILKAIKKGSFEAYIGKFSGERIALWINRFAPRQLIKRAPKLIPK